MLTLAIFSKEGQLLAYNLEMQDARIYERSGLIVKMIEQPHIELMTDGKGGRKMRKGDRVKYHRWSHNLTTGKEETETIEAIYRGKAKGTQYNNSDYIVYNLKNGYECGISKYQLMDDGEEEKIK